MAYPADITPDTISSLLARKELYSLIAGPHREGVTPIDPGDHLRVASYQLFIKNLINPATPYRKIHLAWTPGMGKTVGALVAATEFIRVYRQLYAAETMVKARFRSGRAAAEIADIRTPSVFVLGFAPTKAAFIRDLIGYSYFGFVSAAERDELNYRRELATNEADQRAYVEYEARLRRRISDKSRGGFYKFLGYEEFVNRLFSSPKYDLAELDKIAQTRLRENPDADLTAIIDEQIAAGNVAVNEELLQRLTNGLLICDEIHETYNRSFKNNRGVAIQYALRRVPTLRFISMSATPITNSPTEIVDFANYFIDKPSDYLQRRDIFDGTRLLPGALTRIGSVMFGKISFVQDTDSRYFPSSSMSGDPLVIMQAIAGYSPGDTLPYLRFIRTPMSAAQIGAIDEYMARSNVGAGAGAGAGAAADTNDNAEEETPSENVAGRFLQPSDGFTVYDMVFPTPNGPSFRTGEVRPSLISAPEQWRRQNSIEIAEHRGSTVISGPFLRRANIATYSPKYARLLDDLEAIYKKGASKVLIYHFRVEMSGVLLIAEMLKENGYLDETGNATENTRCVHCGEVLGSHTADHAFAPVRFLVAHSRVDPAVLRDTVERFRADDNIDGSKYAIMIGGQIIKQGYDFKGVETVCCLSLSTSIQIMLQIIGRAIRKKSHSLLPPERRHVDIRIYAQMREDGTHSPEELRYIEKVAEHQTIQVINRELHAGAVDANVNRAINMSPQLTREYFPDGSTTPQPRIDTLYYTPHGQMPTGIDSTLTYYAHGYYQRDIYDISMLVKRAFMNREVWLRDDLYQQVRIPDVSVEVNPITFTRPLFNVAMKHMTAHQQTVSAKSHASATNASAANVYNHISKYVYVGGTRCNIVEIGEYYAAIPVALSESARGYVHADAPVVDAETYMRRPPSRGGVSLTIAQVDGSVDLNFGRAVEKWHADTNVIGFFTIISQEMQIQILRKWIDRSLEPAYHEKMRAIETILRGLGALITYRQVMLFKDVAAAYVGVGAADTIDDSAIVGYSDAKLLRLYNSGADAWIDVKRTLMNKKADYIEAPGIVGVLETSGNETKLKLRKSLGEIKEQLRKGRSTITDTRTIDRGMNCETRPKTQLVQLSASLGIAPQERPKVRNLCRDILGRLIELEQRERAAKSRQKYLYGWWDEVVNIKAIVA